MVSTKGGGGLGWGGSFGTTKMMAGSFLLLLLKNKNPGGDFFKHFCGCVVKFLSPLLVADAFSFLFFFCFYLTAETRSPGTRGVLGLGDEV